MGWRPKKNKHIYFQLIIYIYIYCIFYEKQCMLFNLNREKD